MPSIRWLSPLLCAAAVAGCDAASDYLRGEAAPARLTAADVPAVRLSAEVLTRTDSLAMPARIAVVQPYLVVLDRFGGAAIRMFDPADGSLVASVGGKGAGPGEFEAAWSLDPVGDGPDFWVYDVGLSRLTRIDVDPAAGRATPDSMLLLRAEGTTLQPTRIGGRLISTGFFPRGRFAVFDDAGRQESWLAAPPPGPPDVPPIVRLEAYQGTLAPHPARGRFALATRHADRLEIFAADGRLVATGERPAGFDPPVAALEGPDRPAFASDADLRFGFLDLAATDRALYALYSGRTRRGFPGRAAQGDHVYVFDWQGTLDRVFVLPADAVAIAVDAGTATLFAIHHQPRPLIARYRLPKGRVARAAP